jgi:hypothetical protein
MTPQEFFTKTVQHLRKQGHRALDADGRCAYRAPNGDMCAIGCLIPDELYDPQMEGLNVLRMLFFSPLAEKLQPVFRGIPSKLLDRMQYVHDNMSGISVLTEAVFAQVAKDFGLEVP